jgi:hypothetical protein
MFEIWHANQMCDVVIFRVFSKEILRIGSIYRHQNFNGSIYLYLLEYRKILLEYI